MGNEESQFQNNPQHRQQQPQSGLNSSFYNSIGGNDNFQYSQHQQYQQYHPQQQQQPQQQSNNMNVLSSMTSNLAQKAAGSANQTGSMFNSIGQLSTSFPNSIKPMNQLINQFHPGSFSGIGGMGPNKSTGSQPPTATNTMTNSMPNITSSSSSSSNANIATTAKSPIPTQVPEVDLSGLTEEEKQMIQSVMARAQQDTQSLMPHTPQAPISSPKISTTSSTQQMSSSLSTATTMQQQQQPQHHPQQNSSMMPYSNELVYKSFYQEKLQ